MKALSIRQPWADAIIHHGKSIENRGWRTHYRGPLLIHAAKTYGIMENHDQLTLYIRRLIPSDSKPQHLGGIIGMVDLVDVVTASDSPWFEGPFGWVLANPRPLPFRPMRGQLGLFEVKP